MYNRQKITWGMVVSSLAAFCLVAFSAILRTVRLCTRFPDEQDAFLWIALRLTVVFALAVCGVWLLMKSWRQASAGSDRRKLQSVLLWVGGGAALACAGLVLVGALTDTVRLCLRVPAAESAIWYIVLRLLVAFLAGGTAARLLREKLSGRAAERREQEAEDEKLRDFERRLREWDE